MYENIIKLFRHCAETECIECAVAGCPGPQKFLKEAADAIEKLNKEVMSLRADYWDVTCDPEYRESHFEKDEWGEW